MAGEYSRELSKKVFIGQCRLINLGYRQGGMAGFGLRRMLVNPSGTPLRVLKLGERKSLQTERVILVPGPEEEVEVVQWIYDQFVNHGKKESEIAKALKLNAKDAKDTLNMVRQNAYNAYRVNLVFNLVNQVQPLSFTLYLSRLR